MVWIDVTEIKNWEGHYTGIQRVISKIGAELMQDGESFAACYFDYTANVFRVIDYDFNREVSYSAVNTDATTVARAKKTLKKLEKAVNERSPERIKKHIKTVARFAFSSNTHAARVSFEPGDVLFIPGAFWIYPIEGLAPLKQKGVKIAGVIYDLVPLVVPQFTAKVTVEGFGARFSAAVKTFDVWFSISENSKRDMIRQAKIRNIDLDASRVSVIRLGVEVMTGDSKGDKPDVFGLETNKFLLLVSTLEARKNQALVYQAVKRLQDQRTKHCPVVLVGKHGWLSDDIAYILRNDPSIRESILWFDRVDDRALQWLYANCRYTIYPSYYEGWGLPVAESLALGKPCIASNSSSIPEIGGTLVDYFSPFSADELAALIVRYEDDSQLEKKKKEIRTFVPTTWKSCSDDVRKRLLNL